MITKIEKNEKEEILCNPPSELPPPPTPPMWEQNNPSDSFIRIYISSTPFGQNICPLRGTDDQIVQGNIRREKKLIELGRLAYDAARYPRPRAIARWERARDHWEDCRKETNALFWM